MEKQQEKKISTKGRAYEERDVKVKSILISALMLVVFIAAAGWLGVVVFNYLKKDTRQNQSLDSIFKAERILPAGPRLQVDEAKDYKTLKAEQDIVLSTYAWIDREKGIVRIPIEKAIDLVLERGLPYRQAQSEQEDKT